MSIQLSSVTIIDDSRGIININSVSDNTIANAWGLNGIQRGDVWESGTAVNNLVNATGRSTTQSSYSKKEYYAFLADGSLTLNVVARVTSGTGTFRWRRKRNGVIESPGTEITVTGSSFTSYFLDFDVLAGDSYDLSMKRTSGTFYIDSLTIQRSTPSIGNPIYPCFRASEQEGHI